MIASKTKISLRQAVFIFFTIVSSAFIRFVPGYTAKVAEQAAWLSPVIPFFTLLLLFILLQSLYKKHPDASLIEVIENIFGKIFGKIIVGLYLLWLIIPLSTYTRYYVERLVSTIFPYVDKRIFIIIMLLLIAYMLRSGIVIIARMNEIIFTIIIISFISIVILIFPQLKFKRITPISYLDIIPVIKSSLGIMDLWIYIIYMFFIGDEINNKERLSSFGFKASLFINIVAIILIIITVGSMGHSVTGRTPLPFFTAVKTISVFDIVEKMESIVIILWVAGDFILLSTLTYILLKGLQSVFPIKDIKPFINIFLIFIYFLSLYICNSRFELEALSATIITYIGLFLTYVIPMMILIVGKIRKKI